jgi:hypothetical protein
MSPLRTLALAAAVLAGLSPQAHASSTATYCIDDNAEFQTVVNTIATTPIFANGVDIRFRPGTFALPGDVRPVYFSVPISGQFATSYVVNLSGGWNAGCSLQAAPGGPPTVIDALGTKSVLLSAVQPGANEANTELSSAVTQIELRNFKSFGVAISTGDGTGSLDVNHASFRNGSGTAIAGPGLYLHNSFFEGNVVPAGVHALIAAGSELTTTLVNNTFRNNTVQKLSQINYNDRNALIALGDKSSPSGGTAVFENNIVHATTLCSDTCYLIATDNNARIRFNIIDPAKFDGTALFNSANYNIDPKFQAGSGTQLAAASPARDIGLTSSMNSIAFDLSGNDRVQGGDVDLGAYELDAPDMLFGDGFE